jgi:hypothetical protein
MAMVVPVHRVERIRVLPKRSAFAAAIPMARVRVGGKFSASAGSSGRRATGNPQKPAACFARRVKCVSKKYSAFRKIGFMI